MNRFKNILLIPNLESKTCNAFEQAVALAGKNKARLSVVDIIDDLSLSQARKLFPQNLKNIETRIIKAKKKQLESKIFPHKKRINKISYQTLKGNPYVEIIRKVLKDKHDLVIISAEGKTRFGEFIFGSTPIHLIRKCPCPVWVLKPSRKKKFFNILAAVDLSNFDKANDLLNKQIVEMSSSLAQWNKCHLHIIYAWQPFGGLHLSEVPYEEMRKLDREAQKEYTSQIKLLLAQYPIYKNKIKIHVKKGRSSDMIISVVKDHHIDLIVMGSLARTGLVGVLIGNTAENVLQQAACSVLTVKPEKFKSPIKLSQN